MLSRKPAAAAEISRQAKDQEIVFLPRQAELTRKWLDPVLPELLARVGQCRKELDQRVRQKIPADFHVDDLVAGDRTAVHYPVGSCNSIRNVIWENLSRDPVVINLRKRGLIWKKVFYIEKGLYFQNAIQCGHYVLDAANDTVNARKASVEITSLDRLHYENVEGWPRYGAVAETYLELRIFPNLYFPLVFPLSPFLALRTSGRIDLLVHQDLLFHKDLGDGWRRARQLLDDRSIMERRLPPAYEKLLADFCGENEFKNFPVEFRPTDRDGLAQVVEEWRQVSALPPEQLVPTLTHFTQIVKDAAKRLRMANLRPGDAEIADLRAAGIIPTNSPESLDQEAAVRDFWALRGL